mmetsp:Transcript_42042/g.135161  ORF Transcript_42042/g.135161 Transcript_42042/m.135161 type:complete len:174 (+) Transcript_42042:1496-2017(+)
MLELVFAPATREVGADRNWIGASDAEVVAACLGELSRLFPGEIGGEGGAELLKHAVVRTPRSVYAATPGRNRYRPSQATPVPNFVLAGDWTSQKFLGSMEGAVLAGKLAAEVIADRAAGRAAATSQTLKPVHEEVVAAAEGAAPREPVGVRGRHPIAFGGGQQGLGETKFEHA